MLPKESGEYPLLIVREETYRMSQQSRLGLEGTVAKMEQFNDQLFGYLYRLHEMLPDLVAPVYNLILLEYELQRQHIHCVTDKTIEKYDADEANGMEIIPPKVVWTGLKQTMLTDKQVVLAKAVDTYIAILRLQDSVLADPTHYGIRHMYFLLRAQAIEDRKPS